MLASAGKTDILNPVMAQWVYFHNLDPFAIHFWDNIGIRWYGLAYIAGILCGWAFILWLIKKSRTPLSQMDLSNYLNFIIFGVLIGGRVGYCIAYQPSLFVQWSGDFPFWGVLAVHKGGMASHGGILGIIAAGWWFARKYHFSVFHILDLAVAGGGFGIIFGRIANFINGELYGRVIEGKAWIGVQFPTEILAWYNTVHYDKANLLSLKGAVSALGSIQSPFSSKQISLSQTLWTSWVESGKQFTAEILSVLNHLVMAVEQGRTQVITALAKVLPVRHPSQLYQALLEGLIPLVIICILWLKPRKAGLISGVWGISYLVMRIIGEQFRLPDLDIGFDIFGLTRGQWLSFLALIPVCGYLYFISKNKTPVY